MYQAHAFAAATGDGFQQHGIAHVSRQFLCLREIFNGSLVPGTVGTSARRASWRPAVFEPSASMASAVGPIKVTPASAQARGKRGIFREKAIARMNRVAAGAARDVHQSCRCADNFRAKARGLPGRLRRLGARASDLRSTSLKTAAERMPSSRQARRMRTAISPRLAIRIFLNMA